jgi:phosphoribosylglycinamide formyltransferase 2
MVTLVSQTPNQFELHLRAVLGLPVGPILTAGPSASAVILADRESTVFSFTGVGEALATGAELRLFGKPTTLPNRRMGVALARGEDIGKAREIARDAAARISIRYGEAN